MDDLVHAVPAWVVALLGVLLATATWWWKVVVAVVPLLLGVRKDGAATAASVAAGEASHADTTLKGVQALNEVLTGLVAQISRLERQQEVAERERETTRERTNTMAASLLNLEDQVQAWEVRWQNAKLAMEQVARLIHLVQPPDVQATIARILLDFNQTDALHAGQPEE